MAKLTIEVPDAIEDLSIDLNIFVHDMMYKLSKHRNKRTSWRGLSLGKATALLLVEVSELIEANDSFERHTTEVYSVVEEAADIANFALFIASIARKQAKDENSTRKYVKL
jgi:NTP pyrophosphatase (non-canonical NTP hydrolase)